MIYYPKSYNEFISILQANQNTLILTVFYMDGCGVCKEMDYYLATLDQRLPIIKLDVNIFTQLANDNEINKVPTSVFIRVKEDKIVWNSQQFIGLDEKGIGGIIAQMH